MVINFKIFIAFNINYQIYLKKKLYFGKNLLYIYYFFSLKVFLVFIQILVVN